jgi:hypothetical protein
MFGCLSGTGPSNVVMKTWRNNMFNVIFFQGTGLGWSILAVAGKEDD